MSAVLFGHTLTLNFLLGVSEPLRPLVLPRMRVLHTRPLPLCCQLRLPLHAPGGRPAGACPPTHPRLPLLTAPPPVPRRLPQKTNKQVAIVFISMHLFFSMGSAKGAAAGGLPPPGKDARGLRPPQLAVSREEAAVVVAAAP